MQQHSSIVHQSWRGLFLAALFTLGATANAGTLFLSRLSGANVLPPTIPTATGLGIIIVNDAGNSSTISANWQGITGITGGRIRRGTPTDNGPIVFPFAAVGNPSAPFTWNLGATALNDMRNGGLFMDITNGLFPDGAIRGQIFRATLEPAAVTAAQKRLASAVLDVSAGLSAELDQILIQTNLATREVQTRTLEELTARTVFVSARQQIEALNNFTAGLFDQAEESRLNPEEDASRFGVFVRGGESFGDRSAGANQAGSTFSSPFALGGVDLRLGRQSRAGLAYGYANSRDTFDAGVGRTETSVKTVQGFLSFPLGGSGVMIDTAVGHGWGRSDSVRNLPTLARVATASPEGTAWSAALRVSRPLKLGGAATFIPYAQIDTQEATIDGYTETGAGVVSLVIPERTARHSSFEGGVTLVRPIKLGTSTLTARLQAGWHHAIDDGADTFATRITGSPLPFTTEIEGLGRNAAHVEAALTGTLAKRVLTTLGYRGLLGAGGQTTHAIEARFVIKL